MEFETRFGPRGFRFKLKPGPGEKFAVTDEARYFAHGSTGWWKLGSTLPNSGKAVSRRTLKDNVRLLTPDILDRINTLVVKEGHKLLMKKKFRTMRD
jgi:hypothetical protein